MAFRPSHRRKRPTYFADLNLAPLMSLFIALIPMLLLTAIFQKVGIVNLYLPTLEEVLLEGGEKTQGPDFTLAVTVTSRGITLRKDDRVLLSLEEGGEDPLDRLRRALIKVKEQAPEKRDAVLLLDPDIRYERIIQVMDVLRETPERELFPDISLADRILQER